MANRRRSIQELKEIDSIFERLRDFIRLNYITGAEVARQMSVRDMTVYSWLQGESRPSKPERITAFPNSIPNESSSGITPNGYRYQEYKNWRGIPKPRRSSSPDSLGTLHADFLRAFVEEEQAREAAVIDAFLKES